MSNPIKLLFLAGSARQDSANKKLAKAAAKMADQENVEATFIDLADYRMPLYDGDLEAAEGLPENAIRLKEQFMAADGFFIASPEYNSSFSPLLKNTIDWMSRPHTENEAPLVAYQGKVAAISGASPGGLGGLRGLVPLRMLLGNIGVTVTPDQLAVGGAFGAFDDNGDLTDERQKAGLQNVVDQLIRTTRALNS